MEQCTQERMSSAAASDGHLCQPIPAQRRGEGAFHHLRSVPLASVELITLCHNVSVFLV